MKGRKKIFAGLLAAFIGIQGLGASVTGEELYLEDTLSDGSELEGDEIIIVEDEIEDDVKAPFQYEEKEERETLERDLLVETNQEEIQDELSSGDVEPVGGLYTRSGVCGDNLTWTLTDDGVLTISGTGDMWNWTDSESNERPFPMSKVLKIIIQPGVTSIGDWAFWSVGHTSRLTSVTIPDSVTNIGWGAFYGCCSLTSVTIPDSVTNIGDAAFDDCDSLTSLIVTSNNSFYSSQEGVLFNKDKTELIRCPSGKTGVYSIPNSVTSIKPGAFYHCVSLTSVSIPDSVTSVGGWAFSNCVNLTSMRLPNNVTSIGMYAFGECVNLTSVKFSNNVTSIEEGAFYDCENLSDVFFVGTQQGLNHIKIDEGNDALFKGTMHFCNYNMWVNTYSFGNYGDSDSPDGHCFGMSITSAGYHLGLLSMSRIGGNANTSLYSLGMTQIVKQPICYYQNIQGSYSSRAIVAGGTGYLYEYNNITSDWQEVVSYVRDHDYDDTGFLQIGFRKNNEGGHSINFLRYENVNGQDRIYAYDNNFPQQETYFYKDSSGNVRQAPVQSFSGAIDCIALRDCRIYYNIVGDFDATHVLYMAKDAAYVQGYTYTYMEGNFTDEEYVMYEIPADQDQVIIIPQKDNAEFIYMDKKYNFGKITDETYGILKLASSDQGTGSTDANFSIENEDAPIPEPKLIAAYNGAKGIGIKFIKVESATDYLIYRKFNGVWDYVCTVSVTDPTLQIDGDRIMYTDTSVAQNYGKGYIYSVAAKKDDLTSTYNTAGVAIYRLTPPALTSITNSAAGTATVTWKGVFGRTETNGAYDLQYAEYKDGKAGTFKSVTALPGYNNLTLSATVNGLKKGSRYVFRIRCSKTNKDRGTYYSEYSPWLSVTIGK